MNTNDPGLIGTHHSPPICPINYERRHLCDILSEIPDFRKSQGKRHPLSAILAMSLGALLCGHNTYKSIAEWGRLHAAALRDALGFTHPKMPCAATLYNVFKHLDIDAFEAKLTEWATSLVSAAEFAGDFVAYAIDGKTLRGSGDTLATRTHLLSIYCTELGITIAQKAVDTQKTNEIPVARDLLRAIDIAGKVFTADALHTQRDFCQTLLDGDADYVLRVKKNQATLYEDIDTLFANCEIGEGIPFEDEARAGYLATAHNIHGRLGATLETGKSIDKANGSITQRILIRSDAIKGYIDWPGQACVYLYHIARKNTKTGKVETSRQYGISSLAMDTATAKDLLTLHRGHWAIENGSHRTRDMTFAEDASYARTGQIPHVMATLRNTAINLLRSQGQTEIAKTRRRYAARPHEALALMGINAEAA